jgi:hypothetical protein
MATVALTTTPTQIDDGTSYTVLVTNTGAVTVDLSRGGRLRPGRRRPCTPRVPALTAAATSGTGTVTTAATAAPQTQAQQVAATIAGLPGTYARVSKARIGNNIGYIGDSLTAASYPGPSVPQYAELLSGGRLHCGVNAGISGNTSTQMLARITDVTTTSVNTCVILAGTNDLPTFPTGRLLHRPDRPEHRGLPVRPRQRRRHPPERRRVPGHGSGARDGP